LLSYFAPVSLYAAPSINLGSDWGNILGYKGHVCKKCFSFEYKPIFDDVKSTSLKSNHACNPQKLYEALFVTDTSATMSKRVLCLTYIVNVLIAKNQEQADLTAVEVPARVFDNRLDSYEEYVDVHSLPSGTPKW
jgi:hypothetical protein